MKDKGLLAYLHELLDPLGRIAMRPMFGGHGVYCDGLFFAIVIDGRLYLKVDDENRPSFEAAGSAPFVYQVKGASIEMSYWHAPEAAMDSAEEMRPWAQLAIAAALRKPAKRRSPANASRERSSPSY
jgi:DNA transformation protein